MRAYSPSPAMTPTTTRCAELLRLRAATLAHFAATQAVEVARLRCEHAARMAQVEAALDLSAPLIQR